MRAEYGQQRLADKIEIYAAEQQPLCQILEIFVKLLADESRFVVGSPVEPEALYRGITPTFTIGTPRVIAVLTRAK